jgi:CO/xanthine dehydrogenase Mo-binding subunit
MSSVGFSVPRADGAAKVSGNAQYVDDIRPPGCLYGATVRSPVPHGKILAIQQDPDFDWTGITLVTAEDIPAQNVVFLMTEDQPALADGVVRHAEEPVALVAAPSRDRAIEAAKHVRLQILERPAVLDASKAENHAVKVYGEDNVFKRISIHKGETVEGGIVVEGTYRMGHQEQLYIEPQGMIAIPREDGGLTILGSMQCPYYIIKALAPMLGHKNINVIQATTGGGFGGKEEYPSMLSAHCALLAIKTGCPVKMVYRRDEDLRATTKRHPAVIKIRTVVNEAGELQQWDADILMDGGAYNTLTPVVLSRAVLHVCGPYRCPNQHIEGVAVATHTPPNGAFRGFGAPQAMFATERHMDRIARTLGMDPVAFRRINLIRDGDTTPTGQALVDTGVEMVLNDALDAATAPLDPVTIHPGGGTGRYASGRGVSLVFHGCGFTGNGEAAIKGKVAIELDGRSLKILTASTDIGQGVDTTFPQIAAGELGIDVDRVCNAPHDTAVVPDSGPTVASRTCMVVGGVVKKAAIMLRQALQAETGLETADFDELINGRNNSTPLRVLAEYKDDGTLQWDNETYTGDAYPTYGWACSVVDLDVDLDTGEVLYRRYASSTDVGKAINPVIVAGQLEGGALQGLGYATAEEVVLDKHGRMRNDRLTNYIIPTSLDAPEMITRVVEIPFAGGPFGAKGLGEIPLDGPAPAVAQAIEAATGIVLDTLPMTPERVFTALEAKS